MLHWHHQHGGCTEDNERRMGRCLLEITQITFRNGLVKMGLTFRTDRMPVIFKNVGNLDDGGQNKSA